MSVRKKVTSGIADFRLTAFAMNAVALGQQMKNPQKNAKLLLCPKLCTAIIKSAVQRKNSPSMTE